MRDLKVPFTGDPDVDFRTHMIPHHQGAIDMARVAMRHAKDPHTRQVAEAISTAQPREIYEFQGWLAARRATPHSRADIGTSAVREFKAVHARTMRNMAMPFTGDPDIDFRIWFRTIKGLFLIYIKEQFQASAIVFRNLIIVLGGDHESEFSRWNDNWRRSSKRVRCIGTASRKTANNSRRYWKNGVRG